MSESRLYALRKAISRASKRGQTHDFQGGMLETSVRSLRGDDGRKKRLGGWNRADPFNGFSVREFGLLRQASGYLLEWAGAGKRFGPKDRQLRAQHGTRGQFHGGRLPPHRSWRIKRGI